MPEPETPSKPTTRDTGERPDNGDAVTAFTELLTPRGRALLDALHDYDPSDELALATRLRRDHPARLVTSALTQARLRQRATAKFDRADASRMFFTADGVEQATRTAVAECRAARFAARGVRHIADLGCGIGGDALALARTGIRVRAVDRDPLTCAVARANADALGLSHLIQVQCADVTEADTSGCDAVFVDPARRGNRRGGSRGGNRGGKGRIFDPEAYSPPLSWAVATARDARHAALKVAPGIPHEAIPEDAAAEWVSHRGDVKEAVLWFGRPDEPSVRATLLPHGATLTADEQPPDPPVGTIGRYLYEPDGAVVRAHLVAEVATAVGGRLIDPTIAYVTSDHLTSTPFATPYEITDALPFNLKRLRALLRERQVGTLTVKKRGSAVEPEELRRKVKPKGPGSATVFLTRTAGAPAMLIGHPVRC